MGVMACSLLDQTLQAFSSGEVWVLKTKICSAHPGAPLSPPKKLHNYTDTTCDDYNPIKLRCYRAEAQKQQLLLHLWACKMVKFFPLVVSLSADKMLEMWNRPSFVSDFIEQRKWFSIKEKKKQSIKNVAYDQVIFSFDIYIAHLYLNKQFMQILWLQANNLQKNTCTVTCTVKCPSTHYRSIICVIKSSHQCLCCYSGSCDQSVLPPDSYWVTVYNKTGPVHPLKVVRFIVYQDPLVYV